MGFNIRSIHDNSSETNITRNPSTNKGGFNIRSVQDQQFELKGNDDKPIGVISYGAKKAIESNTLDSYKPKDEEEKKTLETYKSLYSPAISEEDAEKLNANLDSLQKEIDNLESIQDKANEYKRKIQTLTNRANTIKHRSSGLTTGTTYEQQIKKTQAEYKQFLIDAGFQNIEDLTKQLSEKKQYKNSAKYLQDGKVLADNIRTDTKFGEYVAKGEALGDEKEDGWFVPDNRRKNTVAYLRNNPEAMESFENALQATGGAKRTILQGSAEYKLAKYGTQEQVENYYAYLGKGETENAAKYLESVEEQLNIALGNKIANEQDTTFKKLAFGVTAGADQFEQGMINLFKPLGSDEYIPYSPTQIASGQVRESLKDSGFKILGSSIGQTAYDAITTTSNMLPSIGASYLSNAIVPGSGAYVGATLMGGSAAGNSYQEKLNAGWDKKQAFTYATVVGVSEAGLQYALGGIGSLGGKISGKSAQAIAKGIDNAALRFAATYGMKAVSEGFEESLQEVLNPFFENLALGYQKNDLSDIEWEQVAYSGMLGALSAGFLEGGTTAIDVFGENANANKMGKYLKKNDLTSRMIEIASSSPEGSATHDLYTKYANTGVNAENISELQLGRLFVNAEADVKNTLSKKKIEPAQETSARATLNELNSMKPEASISIGDKYKDTKTGRTFTVVGRSDGKTVVEIETPKGTTTQAFADSRIGSFVASEQIEKIESGQTETVTTVETPAEETSSTVSKTETVAENATVESSAENEVVMSVRNALTSEKLTSKQIDGIISNQPSRDAFTQLTGVKIEGTKAEQRAIVRHWHNSSKLNTTDKTPSVNESTTKGAVKVTDEQASAVVDAINETLKEGALEEIYASMPSGYEKSLDVWARKLISAYNKVGGLGYIADYFTDGGAKVISAIESTLAQSNVSNETVVATTKNTEDVLQNQSEGATIESKTTTRTVTDTDKSHTVAYTNDNQKIDCKFKVMSVDDLIVSNDIDGKVNPNYPQNLQPRDRSRDASQLQITQMSANLNPARLAESTSVLDGAPIVGPDNAVESGNGRTLAIKLAYLKGYADNYKSYIINNADKYGIDVSNLPDKPVLVRERLTEVDRVEFTRKANESSISSLSATEQARVDAEKLTDKVLNLLVANDDGEINTKENKNFIDAVVNHVFSDEDLNNVVAEKGRLSQRGKERIRNAIFYKAYGDASLSARLSESLDNDMKNATNVLLNIAQKVLVVKNGIESGDFYNFDFSGDITSAINLLEKCREENKKIAEYAAQTTMFAKESQVVMEMAYVFETLNRGAKRATDFYNLLLDKVVDIGSPKQAALFDVSEDYTKETIFDETLKRYNEEVIAENTAKRVEPTTKHTVTIPEIVSRSESESRRDDDGRGKQQVSWGKSVGVTEAETTSGVQQDNGRSEETGVVTDEGRNRQTVESTEGKSEIREENSNEQTRSYSLSENSGWGHNGGTRKQTERISYFKRKNQGRNATERQNFARELIKRGQAEEVTKKIGKYTYKYTLVKPEHYNDDMLSMVEEAKAKGVELGFFIGNARVNFDSKDKFLIDGIKISDSQILVQYDEDLSPQKLFQHELGHAKWKTRAIQEIKNIILNNLSEADKNTILSQDRYNRYMEIYKNEDIVLEEFVCDVMSGMNEYTANYIDVVTDYWYGNEEVDSYSPADYTTSTDAGGENTERYSLNWRTDLNQTQYKQVEKWISQVDNHDAKRITDTSSWYKGRIDGEDLFVVYSTEEANPTILYERKGVEAKAELNILQRILEDIENGRSNDEKSAYVNWVSGGGWMQKFNNSQNNLSSVGSGQNNQNARVLQSQSQRNGSPAFWSILENLFERQEQDGSVRFSLKNEIESLPAEDQEIVLAVRSRAVYSNSIATMSESRLSKVYSEHSDSNPTTTNGYLAYIEPYDFLSLTTTSTESFLKRNTQRLNEGISVWGNENNIQNSGPLYLRIDDKGNVVGHEGRHRMAGLLREGVDRVAVVIETSQVDNAKPISIKKLSGQDFGNTKSYSSVYVHNMLPISKEYENINKHIFGDVTEGNKFVEPNIRYSIANISDSDYLKAVEEGDMEAAQKMVDEVAKANGYNIHAYHGTSRGDRVGNVFLPERATSGPMAFFTDDKEIAEGYSKSKQDTSMAYDPDYDSYETQFRIKMKNRDIPLYRAWGYLPFDARNRITQKAQQLREDWDGDGGFILDPNNKEANGGFQWQMKEARGNTLLALNEQWLNSGNLFNEESRYLEVLEMAGVMEEFKNIGDIYFKDPKARHERVYDTYLRITKPFDTSSADDAFVDDLLAWYEEQDESQYERESMESDLWDKNGIDAYEFADRVRSDIENGTFHAWTSIPDSVTDYLKSLGYNGIKDLGGKNSDVGHTVWIPFSSEQIKSSEPVTYDDNGNVIPISERFNDRNKDIRYSVADYAPTFYSQMGKVIDEMKQDKIGANSVVSYLKGRGVKAEEIKWSGIEDFLEGKKSVTKAELQEFVAGSQLQIEETVLDNRKLPYSQEQAGKISEYESQRNEIFEELKREWKKAIGTDLPMDRLGGEVESYVVRLITESDRQFKESTDVGKEMVSADKELKSVFNREDFGYDFASEAYHDAVRNPQYFMEAFELTDEQKAIFEGFIKAKENYKSVVGIPLETQRHIKDIAAKADDIGRKLRNVESERTAEEEKYGTKWDEYKLDGGENYREITFKMPDSTYSNTMMQTHWGTTGIIAHARIQDFYVDGQKMLFIEEIQSDWHNEGHKRGYVRKNDADVRAKRQELENYIKSRLGKENSAEEIEQLQEARREYIRLGQNMSNADAVPDAPFRNSYHEYVLKRLIRMAAEQGYDSIGWTPSDIQSERWSDEFTEGYRIEYDQDIPKFLNKYGKKWGAKVGRTWLILNDDLDEANVWYMPITDPMKNSVLYEGQARYSLATDGILDLEDLWSDAIDKYGTIPKGEIPARDVSVPKKINEKDVVSLGARTMMEAGVTPDWAVSEFEKAILDGTMTHEVITNKKAGAWAKQQIEHLGFEEALNSWSVYTRDGKVGKRELALGMELYNQCITNKDVHNAMKIAAELVAEATNAGQTLQAVRMLKRMTPDGQLYYLEKSIQKMNEEFKEKLGKKFKDIELDESLIEEFLTETDAEKRDEVYDKICQNIADQIPSTWRDKWNAWRYLAMLGNPRTHIRNVVGNAIFIPSIRLKNYVGAVVEKVAKVDTAERTKSLRKSKEAVEFAKQDVDKMIKALQGENAKYAVTSDIQGKRTIFKTKWLEKLRLKNFDFLEMEDMWFLKYHYADALARLITARNIDVSSITPKMLEQLRAYAVKEAQTATYRDANALADGLNAIQRKIERSDKKIVRASSVLIEGVMPFKKTPMNIAKQGIYYSPVGILKGIYTVATKLKKGDATVTDVIDDISKGLSGTMVMMLGYFLASLGLLVGAEDKDKKEKEFDNMTGEQSYALKIGEFSYTIDWATPSNLALFVGSKLFDLTKEDFSFADVVSALSTVSEPLLELSVFSGVNGVIESAQYSDSSPAIAITSDMITSYLMQALPTIGGQISRIIDDNKREYYYVDKTSDVPKGLQRLIGQASSKIPFAGYLFETSIDEWGRDETYGNIAERAFENTVSPGYYSTENYTRVDKELRKLYEKTGDSSVLPTIQQKYYTEDYVKYDMTAEEYTKVKKLRGRKSFELVRDLISSSDYMAMTDNEKVKAIKNCYTDAGDYAKEQMIDKVKRKNK